MTQITQSHNLQAIKLMYKRDKAQTLKSFLNQMQYSVRPKGFRHNKSTSPSSGPVYPTLWRGFERQN